MKEQTLACCICHNSSGKITTTEIIDDSEGSTEIPPKYCSVIEGGSIFDYRLSALKWEKWPSTNNYSDIWINEKVFICNSCKETKQEIFQKILNTSEQEKLEQLIKSYHEYNARSRERIAITKKEIKKTNKNIRDMRNRLNHIRSRN